MNGEYNYNAAIGSGLGPTAVEYSVDPATGAIAAIMGGILLFMMLFGLVFYVYIAYCLMKIAKKTGTPNAWFAWIPILNVILMVQIANKPIWWLLLFFIPFINIIFTILVWMGIAKRLGKPEWWGVLIIVPLINLVVPGYLAFSDNDGNPDQESSSAGVSNKSENKETSEQNDQSSASPDNDNQQKQN